MPSFCSGDNAKRMNKKFGIFAFQHFIQVGFASLVRFQIFRHIKFFNAEFLHLFICQHFSPCLQSACNSKPPSLPLIVSRRMQTLSISKIRNAVLLNWQRLVHKRKRVLVWKPPPVAFCFIGSDKMFDFTRLFQSFTFTIFMEMIWSGFSTMPLLPVPFLILSTISMPLTTRPQIV